MVPAALANFERGVKRQSLLGWLAMEVCPVCETPHAREALECATCGHIFHPAAVEESVVALAELEPTRAADLPVPLDVTPGLEPTRLDAPTGAVPTASVEGLEPTLASPMQVPVEPTPGLEPNRLAEEEFPSIFAADVTCPSCGEISAGEESFCAKCGMHLPRVGFAPEPAESVEPELICGSCGGRSFAGGRCLRCGVRAPPSD